MTAQRSFGVSLAAAAVGGLLIVLATGRRWAAATVAAATGGAQHVSVTGHDVAPGLSACGWAVLVLTLAMVATRGRVRRGAGSGVLVAGLVAALLVVSGVGDVQTKLAGRAFGASVTSVPATANAWPWIALVGAVAAVVSGAAALLVSGSWPTLGRRYDPPTSEAVVSDDDAARWAALDRGEDPTA